MAGDKKKNDPIRRDEASGTWGFVTDVALPGEGRRQVRRGGFRRKKDARAEFDKLRADRANFVRHTDPTRQTVAEFLHDEELPSLRVAVKKTTMTTYRLLARHVRRHRVGNIRLQQLRTSDLSKMYADLLGQGLSATTVRMVHGLLHRAFADAVLWNYLYRNPATGATLPKAPKPELAVWGAEQLRTFLDATAGSTYWPVWAFLAMTGARRGEALGLRWSDVDLGEGRVRIRRSLVPLSASEYDGQRYALSDPKTGEGRTIAIGRETVRMLRWHRTRQNALRLQVGSGWRGDEWGNPVFTAADGSPVQPRVVSQGFAAAVADLGTQPKISLHGLRHSHATSLLNSGEPPSVVQGRLGHSSLAMTTSVYFHWIPGTDASAAEVGEVPLGALGNEM